MEANLEGKLGEVKNNIEEIRRHFGYSIARGALGPVFLVAGGLGFMPLFERITNPVDFVLSSILYDWG